MSAFSFRTLNKKPKSQKSLQMTCKSRHIHQGGKNNIEDCIHGTFEPRKTRLPIFWLKGKERSSWDVNKSE